MAKKNGPAVTQTEALDAYARVAGALAGRGESPSVRDWRALWQYRPWGTSWTHELVDAGAPTWWLVLYGVVGCLAWALDHDEEVARHAQDAEVLLDVLWKRAQAEQAPQAVLFFTSCTAELSLFSRAGYSVRPCRNQEEPHLYLAGPTSRAQCCPVHSVAERQRRRRKALQECPEAVGVLREIHRLEEQCRRGRISRHRLRRRRKELREQLVRYLQPLRRQQHLPVPPGGSGVGG